MITPLKRIRRGACVMGIISVLSVSGYWLISGKGWLESVYWYVITVSSVGYTENSKVDAQVQVFSIVVIVVGMSAAIYTFGGFLELMTEGEIERALGVRRMSRQIRDLSGHIIVCGYGRMGQILVQELSSHSTQLLVVDKHPDRVSEAKNESCIVLGGDATEEEILVAAGVERAKFLVSALPGDAENVFITLTSRNLNPGLHIIARGEQPTSEKKLLQAGADRVVLPMMAGAQRIARIITRPHTADLMEQVVDRNKLDAEMDELHIPANSPLVGQTVRDAETRRKHRLLIVAVSRENGESIFNPDADHTFAANDTIIVMGRTQDIELFRSTYGI